jgi:hypothetical protein
MRGSAPVNPQEYGPILSGVYAQAAVLANLKGRNTRRGEA